VTDVNNLLKKGVTEGVFPGAILLAAKNNEIDSFFSAGRLSSAPGSLPVNKDTIFDLASLTKPLATALAMMRLVDKGKIGLDQPLSELLQRPSLKEKKKLTPRLLLCHSAGLPDWRPFYLELIRYEEERRKNFLREKIIEEPFFYHPGRNIIYSDLGFMILEWIIEAVSGMPMHRFIQENFYSPLGLKRTFLSTEGSLGRFRREDYAATEECPWRKRLIQGEVHDENAYALGGYSGHAGLFGTAGEVLLIMKMLEGHYRGERDDFFSPGTVREFFRCQYLLEESTLALGWDTPSPLDSSSGKWFSPNSVGHLGFTGTSVWMDIDQNITIILLTNRVHPTRKNEKIKKFRPAIHNKIMEEYGRDKEYA